MIEKFLSKFRTTKTREFSFVHEYIIAEVYQQGDSVILVARWNEIAQLEVKPPEHRSVTLRVKSEIPLSQAYCLGGLIVKFSCFKGEKIFSNLFYDISDSSYFVPITIERGDPEHVVTFPDWVLEKLQKRELRVVQVTNYPWPDVQDRDLPTRITLSDGQYFDCADSVDNFFCLINKVVRICYDDPAFSDGSFVAVLSEEHSCKVGDIITTPNLDRELKTNGYSFKSIIDNAEKPEEPMDKEIPVSREENVDEFESKFVLSDSFKEGADLEVKHGLGMVPDKKEVNIDWNRYTVERVWDADVFRLLDLKSLDPTLNDLKILTDSKLEDVSVLEKLDVEIYGSSFVVNWGETIEFGSLVDGTPSGIFLEVLASGVERVKEIRKQIVAKPTKQIDNKSTNQQNENNEYECFGIAVRENLEEKTIILSRVTGDTLHNSRAEYFEAKTNISFEQLSVLLKKKLTLIKIAHPDQFFEGATNGWRVFDIKEHPTALWGPAKFKQLHSLGEIFVDSNHVWRYQNSIMESMDQRNKARSEQEAESVASETNGQEETYKEGSEHEGATLPSSGLSYSSRSDEPSESHYWSPNRKESLGFFLQFGGVSSLTLEGLSKGKPEISQLIRAAHWAMKVHNQPRMKAEILLWDVLTHFGYDKEMDSPPQLDGFFNFWTENGASF